MDPMSSLSGRLAAVAVALLSLAVVAVLVLRAAGAPIGLGPSTAATPSVPPSASEPAEPSASQDPLETFGEIESAVREMRGLPAAEIGPPDVISRAELADVLARELDATWTDEQLAADNLTLLAMGLLQPGQDVKALTQQLYEGQVLGFYDFEEKRMVVVTDAGLNAEALITYAHEYTHALQDAAFDTGAAHEALAEEDDAALARLALEEGDATLVMFQWALANLSPEQLGEVGATPLPDMSGIPDWMVAQLEFPYLAGAEFVGSLWSSGGWGRVDEAYDQPPASTEQILHPEKYADGEGPASVEAPPLAIHLGEGWEDLEDTSIGEAMTGIWLQQLGLSEADAGAAAGGWGGDRIAVARGPEEGWSMAWMLAWDSTADADEFAAAYEQADRGDIPATRLVRVSDTETLVLHASSDAVLNATTVR